MREEATREEREGCMGPLSDEQHEHLEDNSMMDEDGNAREDATMEEIIAYEEREAELFPPDEEGNWNGNE